VLTKIDLSKITDKNNDSLNAKKSFDFFVKGLNHIENLPLVDEIRTKYFDNVLEFNVLIPIIKELIS